MFCQSAQNRAILKSRFEEEIIRLEHNEDNRMFEVVCLYGAESLGEYSGLPLHAYSILMLYSVFPSGCCQKPDAGFGRPVVKQVYFNVLERLDLSKDPIALAIGY